MRRGGKFLRPLRTYFRRLPSLSEKGNLKMIFSQMLSLPRYSHPPQILCLKLFRRREKLRTCLMALQRRRKNWSCPEGRPCRVLSRILLTKLTHEKVNSRTLRTLLTKAMSTRQPVMSSFMLSVVVHTTTFGKWCQLLSWVLRLGKRRRIRVGIFGSDKKATWTDL